MKKPSSLRVRVCTPTRKLANLSVRELLVPSADGSHVSVRPGQAGAVMTVYPGLVALRGTDGTWLGLDASWGMVSMDHGEVRVLLHDAELHAPSTPPFAAVA
jgi:F0F1-type ATP synthase epsilon subunit